MHFDPNIVALCTVTCAVGYLMTRAGPADLEMTSLVAEIPGYLQGRNPMSIEAVMRRLAKILRLPLDLGALLVDPTILILDDALSSVDTETERRILSRLRGLMRERTSIVIAHRISTVRDADLIAVVDEGRIVELGDHAALLAQNGLYADLYRQQQLEEEIEAL